MTRHFILIHVPRTGGQFIRKVTFEQLPGDWFIRNALDAHTPWELVADDFAELPMFAVIRNPWDWYVSWYHYLTQTDADTRTGPMWMSAFEQGASDFPPPHPCLHRQGVDTRPRARSCASSTATTSPRSYMRIAGGGVDAGKVERAGSRACSRTSCASCGLTRSRRRGLRRGADGGASLRLQQARPVPAVLRRRAARPGRPQGAAAGGVGRLRVLSGGALKVDRERHGRRRPVPGRRHLGGAPVRARPAAARPRGAVRRAVRRRLRRRRAARALAAPPTSSDVVARASASRSASALLRRRHRARPSGCRTRELRRAGRAAPTCCSTSPACSPTRRCSAAIPVRVYLDLDPAFNQLWHDQGIDMRFDGHTHFVTVGQAIGTPGLPRPDLRPGLDPDAAAGRARALAGRRRTAHDALHHGRQLARLRLDRARRRPLRPEGALAAPAHDAARHARASRFVLALGDPSRRDARPRGAGRERLGARRSARRWPARRDSYQRFVQRLAGRARHRQERLRALALRLVQRSQRLLSRLRAARGRPGDRLQPLPADRRGAVRRSQTGRGVLAAIERDRSATTRGTRARRARSPRSASTPTGCSPACSSASGRRVSGRDRAELRGGALEQLLGAAHSVPARAPAVRLPHQLRARGARRRARPTARALELMFKDLGREALSERRARGQARVPLRPAARDRGLPRSCWRPPDSARPTSTAPSSTPSRDRYWLFLENVPGARCARSASSSVWQRGGALAGALHERFAGRAVDLRAELAPAALRRRPSTAAGCERALASLAGEDSRRARSSGSLGRYDAGRRAAGRAAADLHPRRVLRLERARPSDRRAGGYASARSTGRWPPWAPG